VADLKKRTSGVVRDYSAISRTQHSTGAVMRDYSSVSQSRHSSVTRDDSISSISPSSSPRELFVPTTKNPPTYLHDNRSRHTSYTSNSNQSYPDHESPRRRRSPEKMKKADPPGSASLGYAAAYDESPSELSQIKQSVQRLRAQRANVSIFDYYDMVADTYLSFYL
jgi:hypothetical protein